MYIALHGQGNGNQQEQAELRNLLDESLGDLFDVATTQDRIDGGITLILRCPGWQTPNDFTIKNAPINVYMTPRELLAGGHRISHDVAVMVQKFGEAIALPHLRRFTAHCNIESVKALPLSSPGPQLQLDKQPYLPAPEKNGSAHLRCRCRPQTASSGPQASHLDDSDSNPEFWREASLVAARYDTPQPGLTR